MSEEATGFLYPFIDSREREALPLLVDLARSANAKAVESARLREDTLANHRREMGEIATEIVRRVEAGGRIFTFGNGGSSTDAALLAGLFAEPPYGRAIAARTLSSDEAILTALGNDVGFELVFQRQLIAFSRAGDVAVGLSTSGNSENLIHAFAEAKTRGLLTIGLSGYDGGRMAGSDDVDHCLVARSESIHRIQEAQDALCFELWSLVQAKLAPVPAVPDAQGLSSAAARRRP